MTQLATAISSSPVDQLRAFRPYPLEVDNALIREFDESRFPRILTIAQGISAEVESPMDITVDKHGTKRIMGTLITDEDIPTAERTRVLTSIAAIPRKARLAAMFFGREVSSRQAAITFFYSRNQVKQETAELERDIAENPDKY